MSKFGNNNIGKMFFGSNSIGKAYYGSNLVFQLGSSPTPPATTVAYIRGGADGSYIDTGITADSDTRVIVWARNFNPTTGFLFGSRIALRQSALAIGAHGGVDSGRIRLDYSQTNPIFADDQFTNLGHYHKYDFYQGVLKVDDITIATASGSTFSNQINIYLFGCNSNGVHSDVTMPIDICACKIYKGETLVRDYTPSSSPSIGFYDAVSQTLFTNAGSGSFSYGVFDPDAYTPLEYISCTKQQYFDTGVYGSENVNIVSKFRLTSSTKTYSRLYGCRDSGATMMYELTIGNTSAANRYFDTRYKSSYHRIDAGSSQTNSDLIYTAIGNSFSLYKNNARIGTATGATGSFTSSVTLYIGSSNINGDAELQYAFEGYIYYFGLDASHSYVPALVNGVAGLYDIYNDVFKASETEIPFTAGPTI